jgi:hypothetical protein
MFPDNLILYCRINGRIVFHLEATEIQRLIANSGTTLYLDIGTFHQSLEQVLVKKTKLFCCRKLAHFPLPLFPPLFVPHIYVWQ